MSREHNKHQRVPGQGEEHRELDISSASEDRATMGMSVNDKTCKSVFVCATTLERLGTWSETERMGRLTGSTLSCD